MAPQPVKRRKLEGGREREQIGEPEVRGNSQSTLARQVNPTEHDLAGRGRSTIAKSDGRTDRLRKRSLLDSDCLALSSSSKTTIFSLQLEELLSELRPKYEERMPPVDSALRKLKSIFERAVDRPELATTEAKNQLRTSHGLTIPFPLSGPPEDAKWKLAFAKPTSVNLVGSYASKTCVSSSRRLCVDMAVTMPSTLFQEKDYLNYRYFHKRAYYLTCLAAAIQEAGDSEFEIKFQYLNGNALQPVILVESFKDEHTIHFSKAECDIRILPIVSESLFPVARTWPLRNCVRPSDSADAEGLGIPTPFYNSSLRSDCSVMSHLKSTHAASVRCAAFKDACILGRTWLRQRGYGSSLGEGGFGHFEWSALMTLLLSGGGPNGQSVLLAGYDSYQLFKAILQFLSSRDLMQSPLLQNGDGMTVKRLDVPQLIDGSKGMNILFKMTPWSYKMLRHDATVSLTMLNDSLSDEFDAAFILQEAQASLKFDVVASITMKTLQMTKNLDFEPPTTSYCRTAYQTLTSGLGDRIKLLHLSAAQQTTFPPTGPPPGFPESLHVTLGFLLDPINAGRAVDHGPAAEDKKAAAAFRNFWGDKAELRRFKDGSILESLVWSGSQSTEPIFQQVIVYILRRHIGSISTETLTFQAKSFHHLLQTGELDGSRSLAQFQPTMLAFELLENSIRDLEGLPLQVRQISRADPKLRYASIDDPDMMMLHHGNREPCQIIVQFEGSSRWPEDLIAIQRTKIAFLLKISILLEEAVTGLTARLGLENTHSPIMNAAYLDIVVSSGVTFRLRIHHEREQNLLDRQIRDKTLDSRSREEAVIAMATYNRSYIHSRSHTQAMISLSTRHPFLSPTVRLVKRWFASHLLAAPHFSDELIELLVARVFVQPYPWTAPSSVTTGFLRTLDFLAHWDWREKRLLIEISGRSDLSADDVSKANARFEAWRKIDPAMQKVVLFVASNLDPEGLAWTQPGPSKVLAARMTALARSAIDAVRTSAGDLRAEVLFSSPITDYDFILHLAPPLGTGLEIGKESKGMVAFKNLQIQPEQDEGLVGFDPIGSYLDDLRALYTPTILFFHHPSRPFIAALWSPSIALSKPRSWKIGQPWSNVPVSVNHEEGHSQVKVVLNKQAILCEIVRLGGTLLKNVEVNEK